MDDLLLSNLTVLLSVSFYLISLNLPVGVTGLNITLFKL